MQDNNNTPEIVNPQKKNKKILWTLLFIVIAVLTVVAVTSQSKDFSFSDFISFLGSLDIKYLILD